MTSAKARLHATNRFLLVKLARNMVVEEIVTRLSSFGFASITPVDCGEREESGDEDEDRVTNNDGGEDIKNGLVSSATTSTMAPETNSCQVPTTPPLHNDQLNGQIDLPNNSHALDTINQVPTSSYATVVKQEEADLFEDLFDSERIKSEEMEMELMQQDWNADGLEHDQSREPGSSVSATGGVRKTTVVEDLQSLDAIGGARRIPVEEAPSTSQCVVGPSTVNRFGFPTSGRNRDPIYQCCRMCSYSIHQDLFDMHARLHASRKQYRCQYCVYDANDPMEIQSHMDIIHRNRPRVGCIDTCDFNLKIQWKRLRGECFPAFPKTLPKVAKRPPTAPFLTGRSKFVKMAEPHETSSNSVSATSVVPDRENLVAKRPPTAPVLLGRYKLAKKDEPVIGTVLGRKYRDFTPQAAVPRIMEDLPSAVVGETEATPTSLKCKLCNLFVEYAHLFDHIVVKHNFPYSPYACVHCSFLHYNKEEMIEHNKKTHEKYESDQLKKLPLESYSKKLIPRFFPDYKEEPPAQVNMEQQEGI